MTANPTPNDQILAALKEYHWDTAARILCDLPSWPTLALVCRPATTDFAKGLSGRCTLLLAMDGKTLYLGTRGASGLTESTCHHPTDHLVLGPSSAFCRDCVGAGLLDLDQA